MFDVWEAALIASSRHAILGTIGKTGTPHLIPVCYALVDGRFVIAIDEKPKSGRRLARLRNMERDARVTLLIERYDDDWTQLAWLRIEGMALVHERGEEIPAALEALRARFSQYADMALEERPLISIEPGRSTSWRWDAIRR
jgi:PPOX class probable F420-dependent enzyme